VAKSLVDGALKKVGATMQGALKQVTGQLGGTGTATSRAQLSSKAQLDRFFAMSDSDFESLRKTHGLQGVQRYTKAMMGLARNR